MLSYLSICLSALVFLGAGGLLTSFLGFWVRGETERFFVGSEEGAWVMIVMLAMNIVCIPMLFSLWRNRHGVQEITSDRLRAGSLLFKGIPVNKRIWFLVLLIAWITGLVLGMMPPY